MTNFHILKTAERVYVLVSVEDIPGHQNVFMMRGKGEPVENCPSVFFPVGRG